MSIPAYSLLLACVMPIVAAGLQKWGASDYDNRQPRQWAQQMQEPRRQRALAAQANCWEALIVFAAALLFAMQHEVDANHRDALCISFIGARLLYLWAYYVDKATLRSLVWLIGYGSALGLIGLTIS
ncbi:MAG: hypothetical protein EBW54_00880 [Betaproteobacteria bacterium]|nr:hypothetical protein [Betaproteobacteria bacterium]NCW19627.1 hypothetical protein [Betaproteobacteria bacterium]NCW31972.1 hypothetical protein [Betaproteobacteria bacterium]NCW97846.1 hypothetical protein [Betaproteobacteria bacterium]NCZ59630.1 hypothetical protein [Betaproteobacteria bacterium]